LAAGILDKGRREPRLADARRARDEQIVVLADPRAGAETEHDLAHEPAGRREVDVFETGGISYSSIIGIDMTRGAHALTVVASVCLAAAAVHTQPRTVAIDGHRIRVQTGGMSFAGAGRPTIVLESGAASPLEMWTPVVERVSRFAAVVAYDRPGNPNGLSERDGQLPTPRYIAGRLHSLLAQLGLEPPYVLVGHSWGGPLIRMFTAVYPKEIAGLVYVDPTDLRTTESGRAYLRAQGYSDDDLARQKRERGAAAARFGDPNDGESTVIQTLGESDYAEFRTLPPLPDVPVSVLMSARFDAGLWTDRPCQPIVCHEQYTRFRSEWLREYGTGVRDFTFATVTASGHAMPREDPDLVVWAIQRVVSPAARR
jgi:pimeloyl-ACP methyl ester carboxylesterase